MSRTVKVASSLPLALRIREPEPNPEKPGLTPPLRTAVLSGANMPSEDGQGVSRVDADLWRVWWKSDDSLPYRDHLRVVDGDEKPEDGDGAADYGFEPGLDALTKGRNAGLAKEGSEQTEAPPVPAVEMKTGGEGDPMAAPVEGGPAAAVVPPKPGRGK